MKRFDDSTKKLIKNVVSLITSAIVLIAATIAWFSSGGPAKSQDLGGHVQQNTFSINYYRQAQIAGNLLSADTGTGTGKGFTFSNSQTIEGRMDSSWTSTDTQGDGAGLWDVTSMIPGSYDVFRVDVGNINPQLTIGGIACKDLTGADTLTDAQKETVYKSVYLYAVALKKTVEEIEENGETNTRVAYEILNTTDSPSKQCIVCGSLYDLFYKPTGWTVSGEQTLKILHNIASGQVENAYMERTTIMLFIGVPGDHVTSPGTGDTLVTNNLRLDHDALRQIGAKLSFTTITVN